MPGRSHLWPPERSQSDSSMDRITNSKRSRKERKALRKSKEEKLHLTATNDTEEVANAAWRAEETEEKKKSTSLNRLFGMMKRPKNKEKEEETVDDIQYESPDGSEFSSSGYFTPQAQTTDYETPGTPVADASEDEDSGYRRSDRRNTITDDSSALCSLNDLLADTTITDMPGSSEVYLLGPTIMKVADENGKLIEPETVHLKPGAAKTEESVEPGREETPRTSREDLTVKPNAQLAGPVDVDSDFSNTSIRSSSLKDSQSYDNLQRPVRPASLGLSFEEEHPAFQKEKTNGHAPHETATEGLQDLAKKSDTETLENVPTLPFVVQQTDESRDSSISSLLESQVSNTDSDIALHEPEPQRKPFSLIAPKPYTKERPKLETVTSRDTLPVFPLSEKVKTEGFFPPPPSPASSVSNLKGEPVKAVPVAPETSPKLRKNSLEKLLPSVPSLSSPVAKERRAMLDSDSITKPLTPELVGKEKQEHLYKVLVIGELGTGKTSIIKRYVHEFFSQHYRATIGVDFALKVLHWNENTVVRLQLWDIAGQERFNNMTRVYYKEAVGAFIVFDVTRAATFDAVMKWKQDLDSKVTLPDGSPIPCLLLANKCDQPKEGIANSPAKLDEFCKEKGFIGWYETSAKDNLNIDDAAKCLVSKILENDHFQENEPQDATKVSLGARPEEKNKKMSCC